MTLSNLGIFARFRLSKLARGLLVFLVALGLAACDRDNAALYQPEVIRIGVLPDENAEALQQRYTGLRDYLSATIDKPVELVIPKDYADLVNQFSESRLELAFFGGLTYLQARYRANAEPLVMRDIDLNFKSYFLVSADNSDLTWPDLKGKSLAFGSRLSTSGHLMPRYYLQQKNIVAESYFREVRFSGTHDATARLVASGEVDVGAANADIIDRMLADGRLDNDSIYIFYETPTFADYVWAIRSDIEDSLKAKIRDAFLSLKAEEKTHGEILKTLGANEFVVARDEYFTILDEVATQIGLLNLDDLRN